MVMGAMIIVTPAVVMAMVTAVVVFSAIVMVLITIMIRVVVVSISPVVLPMSKFGVPVFISIRIRGWDDTDQGQAEKCYETCLFHSDTVWVRVVLLKALDHAFG